MVNPIILPEIAAKLRQWSDGRWFERAAVTALGLGRFENIMDRKGESLYLLRSWLHEPATYGPDNAHSSANACMLHYFVRPDDDGSCHDHPWDFTSVVLTGGYTEFSPLPNWVPCMGGPAYGEQRRDFMANQRIVHKADDLHAISYVIADTWTMVQTGPKVRTWGFHPPGKPWVPWRTYLGLDHPNYKDAVTPLEKIREEQPVEAEAVDIRDPVDGRLVTGAHSGPCLGARPM